MFWHIKYIRCFVTAIVFVLFVLPAMAQETVEERVPTTVEVETREEIEYNKYEKRYYSRERLEELKSQPEFKYDSIEEKIKFNLREMSDKEYFSDTTQKNRSGGNSARSERESRKNRENTTKEGKEKNTSTVNASGGSFNWILILILFLVLVGILMAALKLSPRGLFSRSGASDIIEPEKQVENIHTMKFETELEKAIRLKNYRLALRIMYLESLKKLTDKGIIHWRPEKTNWEYVREINDNNLRTPFTEITNAYDYAWYGEFAIDESTFRMMQDKINSFKQKLSS
jgi:Domain of unknown function (DUF4129)